MSFNKLKMIAAICLILLLFSGSAYAEDLLVIANRSVPEASLSEKDIQRIYLGKKRLWGNKMKIVFVKLNKGDTTKRFLKKYVKKSERRFTTYWDKKVFTGGGRAPKSFAKQKDLVKYVSETKGAIGYIDATFYNDSVKIVSTSR